MNKVSFSARFCRKCLQNSLEIEDMIRFAEMVNPDYDFYQRSGYSKKQLLINQDVASRIVVDMLQDEYYVDFVEFLIEIDSKGHMGRRYAMRGLDDVIDDVINAGYSYDKTTGQFFENQRERITRNWGRLVEGDERQMAVIRLDIVGNSVLVKENKKDLIDKAYGDLRKIVTKAVVSRLGRLWIWEGDGALGAFMLGSYSRMAIFAAVEILNEMFIYNKTGNPLNSEIKLRLAVHTGLLTYSNSDTLCQKTETVRKAITLESKAAVPNSLVISESLALTADMVLLETFSHAKAIGSEKYRIYQLSQKNE